MSRPFIPSSAGNTPARQIREASSFRGTYDGTSDLDEHIKNIYALLVYHGVPNAIKCRMFPTTLDKGAIAWHKSLLDEFITSWKGLGRLFSRYFTASRRHPKFKASLEVIIQGKYDPLRVYIERFNKEAIQVSTTGDMKK